MKHYYFGHSKVLVFNEEAKNFEPLNNEQVAFYEQCISEDYTPSEKETRALKRDVVPFDLEAYKKLLFEQVQAVSINEVEKVFPAFKRENCRGSVYENSAELLLRYYELVPLLQKESDRLTEAILGADSKEAVDAVFEGSAIKEIVDMFDFKTIRNE